MIDIVSIQTFTGTLGTPGRAALAYPSGAAPAPGDLVLLAVSCDSSFQAEENFWNFVPGSMINSTLGYGFVWWMWKYWTLADSSNLNQSVCTVNNPTPATIITAYDTVGAAPSGALGPVGIGAVAPANPPNISTTGIDPSLPNSLCLAVAGAFVAAPSGSATVTNGWTADSYAQQQAFYNEYHISTQTAHFYSPPSGGSQSTTFRFSSEFDDESLYSSVISVIPLPISNIAFVDETGTNPLPPGIQVTLQTPSGGALVAYGEDYIRAGGLLPVNVIGGTEYVASFVGTQAPTDPLANPTSFVGSNVLETTVVTVSNYRSPAASQLGYTEYEMELLPIGQGWWGDDAKEPGGIAWALGFAAASVLGTLDYSVEQVLETLRVYSCTGTEIDTWANDFLTVAGLPRAPGETDVSYRARVIQRLTLPPTTIPTIAAIVQSWLVAFGYGYLPVIVFDAQSNPTLALQVEISPPEFCILIAYQTSSPTVWYLDESFLDVNTFLGGREATIVDPLTPAFDALVRSIKAEGTVPVYATTSF